MGHTLTAIVAGSLAQGGAVGNAAARQSMGILRRCGLAGAASGCVPGRGADHAAASDVARGPWICSLQIRRTWVPTFVSSKSSAIFSL